MCGIFGYTGNREAAPLLLRGLSQLEYRGYDSAGIAVQNGQVHTVKSEGNIENLRKKITGRDVSGLTGIAHTRWATHGPATEYNAHPHQSHSGRFTLVHNGIVENYLELKSELSSLGYTFLSDTDTEVLVNLLDKYMVRDGLTLIQAMKMLLEKARGKYAISLIDNKQEDIVWAIRKGAPLIVGTGIHGLFISSDLHAFEDLCEKVIFPEDHEIICLRKGQPPIFYDLSGAQIKKKALPMMEFTQKFMNTYMVQQDEHFEYVTFREIHEQPAVMAGLVADPTHLAELQQIDLTHIDRILLLGCGTSLHAAHIARVLYEKHLRIPVVVEQASEFKYSDPILRPTDLVIGISQSGETADTLQALELAKKAGIRCLGITNTSYSSLTRLADATVYLKAGKETGVASTKAFTAQLVVFIQIMKYLNPELYAKTPFEDSLKLLPEAMQSVLKEKKAIEELAAKYYRYDHFLFLGRGIYHALAMEGALKLKELSYVHAEGYASAEMKHGPLALIDEKFPTFLIACDPHNHQKDLSTALEVLSRKGKVISLLGTGEGELTQVGTDCITLPAMPSELLPIVAALPLQLFSYYMAHFLERNVDRPRNLAKSVTVE